MMVRSHSVSVSSRTVNSVPTAHNNLLQSIPHGNSGRNADSISDSKYDLQFEAERGSGDGDADFEADF